MPDPHTRVRLVSIDVPVSDMIRLALKWPIAVFAAGFVWGIPVWIPWLIYVVLTQE